MKSQPSYPSLQPLKLTSFECTGRAEKIRLALTIGNVPFHDERISATDWMNQSYPQLPVLTVDGRVYAQSHAITRYAGVVAGLYPSESANDALLVDEIDNFSDDILRALLAPQRETNERVRAEMGTRLATKLLPDMLALLEARVDDMSKGGPFVLEDISIADVAIYCTVAFLQSGSLAYVPATKVHNYTKLMAIYNAMHIHPKVVEWNSKEVPKVA
ncbi:Aste57867_2985 [Aphanomyces stellatus]|uniref:Aste57867_2985 protein n=1 Tax=Aphanomyces stellatus TaxID=120398 RepID=A0A485K9F3_9STRA|nr:hypothetical protein As57867_002976 [Aphanomyces stellatus]VFT80167.1 Aste57867_2985 [Aphanomyces stellatus]